METTGPSHKSRRRPHWNASTKAIVSVLILVIALVAPYAFRIVLVPLIIGAIISAIFYPAAHRVSRWTHLSQGLAAILIYAFLIVLVIPVIILLIPTVATQIRIAQAQFLDFIDDLDEMSARTIEFMGFTFALRDVVSDFTSALTSAVTRAATSSIGFMMGAARIVLLAVFSLVIGLYLTRDGAKIVSWVINRAPPAYRADVRELLREVYRVWSSFFRGQILLSITVGLVLGGVSALLGLPQPILLGLWGGLLEFMPSIGNVIWGATALLLAIFQGSTYLPLPPLAFVALVLGVYVVFTQLDMNILIPNIIGGSIRLHPIVVLLGVIVGVEIGGVLGVALAAPTIASLRVLGRYIYAMLFDLDPFADIEQEETNSENH